MTAVEITVRGSAEACHPRERALVVGNAAFEGTHRADVHADATARAGDLQQGLVLASYGPPSAGGRDPLRLVPEDVRVAATVEARFRVE